MPPLPVQTRERHTYALNGAPQFGVFALQGRQQVGRHGALLGYLAVEFADLGLQLCDTVALLTNALLEPHQLGLSFSDGRLWALHRAHAHNSVHPRSRWE